jgi:hypothetical protein
LRWDLEPWTYEIGFIEGNEGEIEGISKGGQDLTDEKFVIFVDVSNLPSRVMNTFDAYRAGLYYVDYLDRGGSRKQPVTFLLFTAL